MPFVKLDCDILESSLWDWNPERHIFITALLMAKPFELKKPTSQLKVDSLEETGWEVPAGKYGLVRASGEMILRKALGFQLVDCDRNENSDFSDGLDALEALGNPDKDSRSRKCEGRRLARIDGGYVVINFQEYRDKDHTATERKRRQRKRERSRRDCRDVTVSHNKSRHVTQAEAEAEYPPNPPKGGKSHTKVVRPAFNLEDWLKELEKDPTYMHVAVRIEYGKMCAWCNVRGVQPTQRRFINWINRTEKPLSAVRTLTKYGVPLPDGCTIRQSDKAVLDYTGRVMDINQVRHALK